jgi:mitochondrial pyruvate carrier 2
LYRLAAVNFFLAIVGIMQLSRIAVYHQSQKGKTVTTEIKEDLKEGVDKVKEVIKA